MIITLILLMSLAEQPLPYSEQATDDIIEDILFCQRTGICNDLF